MTLPLSGFRVIDLTVALAGPWCTHILACLGAEVIKIEGLSGDDARAAGPPFWEGRSPLFLAANGNKRSVAVDLTTDEGREIAIRLARSSDVFVQNLRPGVAERLGLGWNDVRELHPSLVYCEIGAFGHRGPLRDRPGYDMLMQAATGIMSITGEPGGRPLRAGPPIVDLGTGMWAAIGVLGALISRQQTGTGTLVDTSLYEAALNWQPLQIVSLLASGDIPPPLGSSGITFVPFEAFDTVDGNVVVSVGNDRLFRRLCDAVGLPELADDPRFVDNAARVAARPELVEILGTRFTSETTDTWIERLSAVGVPVSRVKNLAEVVADPQFDALGMLSTLSHPDIDDLRVLAPPLSIDRERLTVRSAAPDLGADSARVLREVLDYSAETIADLSKRGVIRDRRDSGVTPRAPSGAGPT